MKAQRRHDLQQSDLAKVIKKAPTFWEDAGRKYLLPLIAVVVIVILIRYRISSNREAQAAAMDSLAQARLMVNQMERLAIQAAFMPPQQAAATRRQFYNDATTAITEATSRSDDKQIAAEALVAKGDLNWTTSQMPALAGAATQPALQFKDPKELLASAAEAYQNVLSSYPDVKHAAIAARFGLAAIDENKGDFDAAKIQYQGIIQQSSDLQPYQQLANERLKQLDELRKPVIIAAAATEPAVPEVPGVPSTQAVPPLIAPPTTGATTKAATTMPASAAPATTRATTTP
jgi:hypothetical protein